MKLVIFDCDGTLVDSQHGIVTAMSRALADADLPPVPRERILSIVGLSLEPAISQLLPEHGPDTVEFVARRYRDAFRAMRQDASHSEPLYEGMLDLIHALGARDDHLLGVATGKSRRGMHALFDRLDLHPYFITVQTADTHPSKPHPSMIATALQEAGVEPDNAVMIGDTTFDIEMGCNAGVATLGVNWGYHPVEHLHRAGAGSVVRSAAELAQAIDGVLQGSSGVSPDA